MFYVLFSVCVCFFLPLWFDCLFLFSLVLFLRFKPRIMLLSLPSLLFFASSAQPIFLFSLKEERGTTTSVSSHTRSPTRTYTYTSYTYSLLRSYYFFFPFFLSVHSSHNNHNNNQLTNNKSFYKKCFFSVFSPFMYHHRIHTKVCRKLFCLLSCFSLFFSFLFSSF
jgi:hypothetical protein